MASTDTAPMPAAGLDVGTSRIVLARRTGEETAYQTQLNAFVTLPHSKLTEGVLKREGIPYTLQEGEIVVHGNESERFADLLHVETRRPMIKGLLNPNEADSLGLIRHIIASFEKIRLRGERPRMRFSVPAPPLGTPEGSAYHATTLKELLGDLGYDAEPIDEGLAVVYGELEDSNYTGIGVSCGGGLCNVCLAYLSVPVISFSVAKAGDFIDSSAAAATGELATRVRIMKESQFHFNGGGGNQLQQALTVYYDDMIQTLVSGLKDAFLGTRNMPRLGRPVPLVLSGGTAVPKGFRERFEKHLKAADFSTLR